MLQSLDPHALHYAVLGVDANTSLAGIRKAYHEKALAYDPATEADSCRAVAGAYHALRARGPTSTGNDGCVDPAEQLDAFRKTAARFMIAVSVAPGVAAKHLVVEDLDPNRYCHASAMLQRPCYPGAVRRCRANSRSAAASGVAPSVARSTPSACSWRTLARAQKRALPYARPISHGGNVRMPRNVNARPH